MIKSMIETVVYLDFVKDVAATSCRYFTEQKISGT